MTTPRISPPSAQPQFDRVRDRRLLGVLALVPSALLALGVLTLLVQGTASTAGLVLLAGHVITQFIVLLVYGSLLSNDPGLDGLGRGLWAIGFVVSAPVALPVYYFTRVFIPARPEPRGFATSVAPAVGSAAA